MNNLEKIKLIIGKFVDDSEIIAEFPDEYDSEDIKDLILLEFSDTEVNLLHW